MTNLYVSPSLRLAVYDNIQQLPADRYQAARRYEIMAAELGTTEEAQMEILTRAERYAVAGDLEAMHEALHNYRLARYLALDSYQPGQLNWAVLVASENGKTLTYYDEETLLGKLQEWSQKGLTHQMIQDSLDTVKKNSRPT